QLAGVPGPHPEEEAELARRPDRHPWPSVCPGCFGHPPSPQLLARAPPKQDTHDLTRRRNPARRPCAERRQGGPRGWSPYESFVGSTMRFFVPAELTRTARVYRLDRVRAGR